MTSSSPVASRFRPRSNEDGMRKQIPLLLEQSLKYSAENFHFHEGIKPFLKAVDAATQKQGFSILLAVGGKQSGKTHIGVHCAEFINTSGRSTLWIEGGEVPEWWQREPDDDAIPWKGAVVVDDAHKLFERLQKERNARPLADFIERCRRRRALLILFSAKPLDAYTFDEQITGRIKPSSIFDLGAPGEGDLDILLDLIARQRGVRLTPYKRSFLLKRVPREVSAIVDCLFRLEEKTASEPKSSTSLSHLAEAISTPIVVSAEKLAK
jgi:chromosomal replication initiation ATPase DnaA